MPGKIEFTNAGGKKLVVQAGKTLVVQRVEKRLNITSSGKQGIPGPAGEIGDLIDGGSFD